MSVWKSMARSVPGTESRFDLRDRRVEALLRVALRGRREEPELVQGGARQVDAVLADGRVGFADQSDRERFARDGEIGGRRRHPVDNLLEERVHREVPLV